MEVIAVLECFKEEEPTGPDVRFEPIHARALDAALVGYLPAPEEAARAMGLPGGGDGLRESLQAITALQYWKATREMGLRAAPLHLSSAACVSSAP
jgi:hypothetical protein